METMDWAVRALATGAGATLVMDAWLAVRKRFGVPTLDFALLGRWAAHAAHGRVVHRSMRETAPVRGELAIGWAVHYATGVVFAALLLAIAGNRWIAQPTPFPAVALGLATVVAPLFVLQPAMGAGIASRRTPTPLRNVFRSISNHAVFGWGLYLAALAQARFA